MPVRHGDGDKLFLLTPYLTLALIHRNTLWVADLRVYSHPATWFVPVLIGVQLAIAFELWATHVAGWWEYGAMPVVPALGVGLTPVLQMTVVPLLTLTLSRCVAVRLCVIRRERVGLLCRVLFRQTAR